jgi:hypothetical protein
MNCQSTAVSAHMAQFQRFVFSYTVDVCVCVCVCVCSTTLITNTAQLLASTKLAARSLHLTRIRIPDVELLLNCDQKPPNVIYVAVL